jgi:hypothetical protein
MRCLDVVVRSVNATGSGYLALVWKQAFADIGGFNETIAIAAGEDIDLGFRFNISCSSLFKFDFTCSE